MSDNISLGEARQVVLDGRKAGVDCPCCGKYVKAYSRPLNESMARSLVWLVDCWQNTGQTWVNIPDLAPRWLVRTNQLATTRWWGLAESDADRPMKGMWRPTKKGINFVKGLGRVPARATTYNGEVISLSESTVSIEEALGTPFKYAEVVNAEAI